jgi:hypothetical protein
MTQEVITNTIKMPKMNTSTPQDYQSSITVDTTAKDAFEHVRNVRGWWAKNVEGSSSELHDEFKVLFSPTWVAFRIVENVPHKRIVWEVTDCYLHWLQDKKEWKGTRVVFDIAETGDSTRVTMTHIGLVPEVECYAQCEQGWNHHIKDSLFKYLTEQKGMPE